MKKPFLKWAGNKYRIIDKILKELPNGKRLVEPFAGSCAVYLNYTCSKALINDINQDLIWLFQHLQKEGKEFVSYCKEFFTPENNKQDSFIELRSRFNTSISEKERAALLLYLNRHAFNGLVRYNSKGFFNTPFGRYENPYFPIKELEVFINRMAEVETVFCCKSFENIFTELQDGDVLYCDPPYAPLSPTSNFTNYTGKSFSLNQQEVLADLIEKAHENGIPAIVSNHDIEFTRKLYFRASIKSFEVQRLISCKASSRGRAPELLAVYK